MKKLVKILVLFIVVIVMSSCLCGRYAGAYYPYGGGYYGGGYNVYSPWVHNGYGGYGGYKPMGGGVLPMPSGNPYNWNNTGGGRTY